MRAILWDSSASLAFLDADDERHAEAVRTVDRLASEGLPGFVTNYVEVETHALLLKFLGRGPALGWLRHNGLTVLRTAPAEEEAARAMLARYADKDWSLCDAISFAVMEARGVREAFSYDTHFRQWGKIRVRG